MEHCCNCELWEPGNSWMMTDRGVVADGFCLKKKKRKQNQNIACKHIERGKPHGFIIRGEGDKIKNLIIV